MTQLTSTVFRVVAIGEKRYAVGLHPRVPEALLSIREVGKRVGYVVPISTVRVHAAQAEARKNGVAWRIARRVFLASIIPPVVRRRKGGAL